jgi:hypothetical protein
MTDYMVGISMEQQTKKEKHIPSHTNTMYICTDTIMGDSESVVVTVFGDVDVDTNDSGGTWESDELAFDCHIWSDFRMVLKGLSNILMSIL